ncbi:hypothetical protein [Streptomyces sp. NBC_00078]|uniref:hypothetical protein n=1 Tax=unclassified Streptomyces TaxID=2593676 RepID=UPI00225657E1|nr:hypothetical protein [Streptomyces sp. NBC_00078]MCX5420907.1 hypothetical protein [Streptomyces sp. NBC_00078]
MSAVTAYGTGRPLQPLRAHAARALLALCALAALLTAVTTPAQAAPEAPTSQAAYLADRLRANPVYVSDQLPREIPRSTAPEFARLAERTGVPTYVLVLPSRTTTGGEGLLAAVHDRLGKDGLYVLIDESSVTQATAYGVRAPADDAATVVTYELPYDAGPLRSFERFVEVVAQGSAKAAARAQAAREKYGDGVKEPARMYIGPTDRRNQSFLTGALLTGVPLLILLLFGYVRWWRRRLPGGARKEAAAAGAEGMPGKATAPRVRVARWFAPVLVLAAAVAIAVTATRTFDQTRSSASPPPRASDLNARIDRVAAGLAQDPVYEDPESLRVLDATRLGRLHARIRKFEKSEGGGPVYVSLVPQMAEDESADDAEAFAAAVHNKLNKDGVYVVADPSIGSIDVFNYGLRLDSYSVLFDLPDSVAYGDDRADQADDHLLGQRLDTLMTILDRTKRTDEPTAVGDPHPVTDPITENHLPPLFATDFWPGLFMGAIGAWLLTGLVAGVLRIVRRVLLRVDPEPLPTESLPLVSPREPSEAYLRHTARVELRALAAEFGAGAREDSRVQDRFDAALLLVDDDPDAALRRSGQTDPATLVTVIVLARAARQALAGDDNDLCCGVNPLHGPAVAHKLRLPVCEACRDASETRKRWLTLPAPDGQGRRTRVPYEDYDSPLCAVLGGISGVVDDVRKWVHVR